MSKNKRWTILVLTVCTILSCKWDKQDKTSNPPTVIQDNPKPASTISAELAPSDTPKPAETVATKLEPVKENEQFTELTKSAHGIAVDLRYATNNNFTKKQIYDCGRCYLRPEAADALIKVHEDLSNLGYGLKVFDCFRPRPYQQRLWDIVPNPDYVTPPTKGSMHSRGLAVDLTIVDKTGKELDMGTAFDFFGKEAHTDYAGHNKDVNANRKLLTETMKKYGYKGIRTEWWHFSYNANYPLDEWVWPCKVR